MKALLYLSLFCHSLWGAASIVGALSFSDVKFASNRPTVKNKFVIELDPQAVSPNKRAFLRPLDAVYHSIRARDVAFDVNHEYDVDGLFVGASLTITSAADAAKIAEIPGIKKIYPISVFRRPQPIKQHIVSGQNDPVAIASSLSTHVSTGVQKVHARGIFGKGIKIGIIDSGIDYTHPFLGGGIGPGKKVVGGYDFVGDDYNADRDPIPDDDPLDQCEGHGTHVAGIIAADPNNPYNITGVAPEVSITAYRIFGCTGDTTDEIILAALLRAAKDGQDILNLSIGGPSGWSSSLSSVVASRIARSGVVVVLAAGNEGTEGSWYTSSPSDGVDVISVGSVENAELTSRDVIVSGVDHAPIPYSSFNPLNIEGEYPIYALSNDTSITNDACQPLPKNTPDLSQFVVIIRRGGCSFTEKVENIQAKGAKRALVYDNGSGFTHLNFRKFPISLISAADGHFLVNQFIAGAPIVLSFPQGETIAHIPNPEGGLMSRFSSYGPTNDFHFKPAIAAPGGNILSLVPVTLGSYAVMSGTSMASPFAAGCAALLLQSKGNSADVARNARTLFETTAQSVPSTQEEGALPQTLTQQGAGFINVYDALFSTTTVSPGELILNDTANFNKRHAFVVTNNDEESKSYKLSHIPAGTALTIQEDSIFASPGPVLLVPNAAQADINPAKFTLHAGQSQTVTVNFSPPENLDASQYPVYSGFIHVAGPGENFHVSYLGLAASLKDKQVVDNTDTIFETHKLPVLLNSKQEAQTHPTNYTFIEDDYPTFVYRLAFGSALVRLDLVEPDLKIKSSLNTRGPDGGRRHDHEFSFPGQAKMKKGGSFSGVKIVGPLYEEADLPRNSDNMPGRDYNPVSLVSPQFANGTDIANGHYRVMFRVLKVTGDRNRQEDYETWVSPIVGITV